MKKYRIVNDITGQIICKHKYSGGRRYRRLLGDDSLNEGFYFMETTKGRAEREVDFLLEEMGEDGWRIEEVKQG